MPYWKHSIKIDTINSQDDFPKYWQDNLTEFEKRKAIEKEIVNDLRNNKVYHGYELDGIGKAQFTIPSNLLNQEAINFRETLISPNALSTRMRTSLALFLNQIKDKDLSDFSIYLTEQITPLFKYFSKLFPASNLYGSEYVGQNIKSGNIINGVRHEDMTSLSFKDSSLDAIICLEVLEHIPNFKKALQEAYRVLDKDGIFIISAPFAANRKNNLIRATVDAEGNITHLMEPEYHGDPMVKKGILCYQHFGWEVLEYMKSIGFKEVKLQTVWSKEYGILGYFEPQWYGIK